VIVLDELLIVLFVNSCEPVSVATVLSMLNVTVLSVTTDVIPVPPAKFKVSVPIVTLSVVDESSLTVKTVEILPISVSTYALIDC
jgi:hypothetical protein